MSLLKELVGREFLAVFFLAASGRRSIDISRISSTNCTTKNNKLLFSLPRDKTNNKTVAFHVDWAEDSTLKPFVKRAKDEWQKARKDKCPFQSVKWHKIRRTSPAKLHSLRNRKAVMLLRSGAPEEEIQVRLGWASLDSLTRYTKMPRAMIDIFDSYDEFVQEVRSV